MARAKWAMEQGYGGIMIFELNDEYLPGNPHAALPWFAKGLM